MAFAVRWSNAIARDDPFTVELLAKAYDTDPVVKELVEALKAATHEVEATIRCVTNEQTRNEMQIVADNARAVLAKIEGKAT